jgi:thiamine biosynthesis protein ThiI
MEHLLVNLFHELALKGENRPLFLKKAKAHVKRALKGLEARLEAQWPMALLFRLPQGAWPEAPGAPLHHPGRGNLRQGAAPPPRP